MTTAGARVERPPGRQGDRFEERRRELANAALRTLSELGYARTSLREIAQHSTFSHGVLHYYFTDKVELITYCVRQYKSICVQRYDAIVTTAADQDGLARGFADGLVATLRDEAPLHRLWYDLRAQALFESSFRADVIEIDGTLERMIERVTRRYAELAGRPLGTPPPMTYALFDGMFQQALLHHLAGRADAGDELRAGVLELLPRLLC